MTELENHFNPEIINKIGEVKQADEPKKNEPKKRFKKIFIWTAIIFFAILFVFSNHLVISEKADAFLYKIPIIGQLRHLALGSEKILKGESSGRINVLLLGIGGKGHDGPYLTDTIMLASFDVTDKKVALLSIPRDLYVPISGTNQKTKINNIDAFAEAKQAGSGGPAISQTISDLLGMPVDYYVRVDFDGFKNIIDKIGGINVDVQNTLDDYNYPVDGQEDNPDYYARYEHLHVDKGLQKMDGTLALKFARSRHAYGAEGSDFARAKRQQLVLEATKNRLLKTGVLLNPVTLGSVINQLSSHINTNLQIWEIIKLWSMFKNVKQEDIINKGLDNSAQGLLYDATSDQGAYILLPNNGDFSAIKSLAQNIFAVGAQTPAEKIKAEKISVEILNGTKINGLGTRLATDLEKYGFNITRIDNSSRQDFDKSVIYDLTSGEKIPALTTLKKQTGASATFTLPDWLKADIAKERETNKNLIEPDFILIIGQDADKSQTSTTTKQ